MGNIRCSILNAADKCCFCEKDLHPVLGLLTTDIDTQVEAPVVIDVSFNGQTLQAHEECFNIHIVKLRLNGKI